MLDDEEDNANPLSFGNKKVSQRMTVMLAGAFLNFALAFIIFLVMNGLTGFNVPRVRGLVEGAPAMAAGLQTGDRITHLNGSRILLYEDFIFELSTGGGQPIDLAVNRDGQRYTLSVTPYTDPNGDFKIGFYPDYHTGLINSTEGFRRVGVWESITAAFNKIIFYIKIMVVSLVRLVTRTGALAEITGPIGFAGIIDETYKATITYSPLTTVFTMLNLTALLSASLGVFNLLPIPALDGGRMMFLLYEGIRRKPVSQEREGMVHFVGFVLLMILAVFIAYQDIVKLL
jgi:regulator of sigma E protease